MQIVTTRHGNDLRVEAVHCQAGGTTMEPTGMVAGPPDTAVSNTNEGTAQGGVGELPVPLTVEAGQVELTVAQVADLKAGDVLRLPDAVLGPVSLRAGGRLVARGELVEVEGRRGVRVLELSLQPGVGDEDPA